MEDRLHQHLSFAFPKRHQGKKGEYSLLLFSVEVQGWLRSLESGGAGMRARIGVRGQEKNVSPPT